MKNKRINRLNIKRKCLALAVASCFVSHVYANPSGANVVRGSASLSTNGNTLTIENSPGTIINWHDFSINAGETTIFNQVNAASSVLNRVTGGNISQILGTLQSNGRVFLINPSGIVFGQNAVVNVAGLVASTLNMTDDNFVNNKMVFNASAANVGSVINQGQISTPNGGFVYLIATNVENSGVINTPSGEAILAAGNAVELVDSTDPRQRVLVKAENSDVNLSQMMTQSNGNIFSVLNKGVVSANTVQQDSAGRVFFKSAGAIETTTSSVVEVKGSINSNGGTFIGFADSLGTYAGSYDASGQNGGFIETSGLQLNVTGIRFLSAKALDNSGRAGTWLLDPIDILIDSILASTISGQLSSGTSVTLDTAGTGGTGNITFDNNVSINHSGSANTTFTLNADASISMNDGSSIQDSGAGTLSVVMLSDRDTTGSDGAISFFQINVDGTVDITSNSGGLTNTTTSTGLPTLIRGSSVNLDITGDINLTASALGNGSVVVEASAGDLSITTHSGDINLNGGGGTSGFTFAELLASQDMDIQIDGDMTLTASSAVASNSGRAKVYSGDELKINFTTVGNNLTLNAGNLGVNNQAIIQAFQNLEIGGATSSMNPTININGGDTDSSNFAALLGRSISDIDANSIRLDSGAVGGAFILTTDTSATFAPLMLEITGGNLEMDGQSGGTVEVGSKGGNVSINLDTLGLSMDGSVGSAILGASGAGNRSSIIVNSSTNGVSLTGSGALIGSEQSSTSVSISSTSNNSDSSSGVEILSGAQIKGNGTSAVSISGNGWSGGGIGVLINSGSISSSAGNISIIGSANGSDPSAADGVKILNGGTITNGTGNIAISGTGANANSGRGVYISDASTQISTTTGNIVISGTGGNGTLENNGIWLSSGAVVSSTGGNIGLVGTGNGVGDGILIDSSGTAITNTNGGAIVLNGVANGQGRGQTITAATISSVNGGIAITGTGAGSGTYDGMLINGSTSIQATGTGNIALNGTGSAAGTSAAGVSLADSTSITSNSGNIVVNGTGQSSSGNSFGIVSFGSPSPTLTSSSGNIFLTGTSVVPTNIGLTTTSISASSGNVTIRGTNGNLALDSATISAGNNINLIATNGDINQNSSGSLTSANLNVNALGAFLNFSSANAFNTATFAVDTLSVKNNASGTVSYQLTRPTSVVLMDAQNASALRVNADQGFSMSGGQINSGGNLSINASEVNLNNASLLAGNNLNVAANNINMVGGSVFDASADVNVLTKNLSMTNSQIQGTNININSVNLAGKLADTGTSSASVLDIFSRITQSAVISMQNSNIDASNNANVAGSSIKLTGSTIQSGNFTTVFSRGTIELEGGAASRGVGITSEIFAENEVLMIAGGQIILNDGASGAGAVVSTNSPNTIYLGFPLLTNNGFVVNGVLDAITNGNSGFFAGGAPAVLDTNLFVTYGGVNGLLRAFFNQNVTLQSTSSEISNSPDSKSVNKKDDDQKECS